jgi:hypothetical protein
MPVRALSRTERPTHAKDFDMSAINAQAFSFAQLMLMCLLTAVITAGTSAAVGAARRSTLRHKLLLARDGQRQANRLLVQLLPQRQLWDRPHHYDVAPVRHRALPFARQRS